MLCTFRQAPRLLTCVMVFLSLPNAVTLAAELRTTNGDRTIVRTVSLGYDGPTMASQFSPSLSACLEPYCVPCHTGCVDQSDACTPCPDVGLACTPCCTRGFWVDLDFLLWWRDERRFPPLVTTQPNAGALPNATILFGGGPVEEHARAGGRLEFGLWIDNCQRYGLGGHFLGISDAPVRYAIDSNELGFFARPFRDASVDPPVQTSFPIANDLANPATTGQLDITTGSELLASDFFVRWLLCKGDCRRLDLLCGYQFARVDEDLTISSLTQTQPASLPSIAVSDIFQTRNEFHGGHFGLQGEYRYGCWGLELLAKFAFGNMRERVFISGSTVTTDLQNNEDHRTSGMLAQATTNGGGHVQDDFAFMEDIGIKLAYYPLDRLKLSIGYSLMYWSSVVRPGDHIDLDVDARLLTANPPQDAIRPAFTFNSTGFHAHGLNLGVEYRF